jgi:hypothetical protein
MTNNFFFFLICNFLGSGGRSTTTTTTDPYQSTASAATEIFVAQHIVPDGVASIARKSNGIVGELIECDIGCGC